MIKVITYGSFDMLHYGHLRLLERAKALGDYLIVGVTSDDFDKSRGKINLKQSFMERVEAVKNTRLADEIIIEEYEGQKIDDIKKHNVDIFTVGSDWEGYFDYLKEYCKVIYLPRTQGISSTEIRTKKRRLRFGIVGSASYRTKFIKEAGYVNGIEIAGVYDTQTSKDSSIVDLLHTNEYDELLKKVDAVYVASEASMHYKDTKTALLANKHVLCESPMALTLNESIELFDIAASKNLILMDAIKTAYSTAYERLVLVAKSGKIGEVVSVDAVCTSLRDCMTKNGIDSLRKWNGMCEWAPVAMLPIFQIFGVDYSDKAFYTRFLDKAKNIDAFTKIDFIYPNGVASVKVALGAKSEGELVISGTKGYIYVPAPWWKTDYFELRFENPNENKRHFYQLEGEGIRNEMVEFMKSIESGKNNSYVSREISEAIVKVFEDFNQRRNMKEINARSEQGLSAAGLTQ